RHLVRADGACGGADLVAVAARACADGVAVGGGGDGDELGAVAVDVEARAALAAPGERGLFEAVRRGTAGGEGDRRDDAGSAVGRAGVVGDDERDGVAARQCVGVGDGLAAASAPVAEVPRVGPHGRVAVGRAAAVEAAGAAGAGDGEARVRHSVQSEYGVDRVVLVHRHLAAVDAGAVT